MRQGLLICVFCLFSTLVSAAERHALIIGNSDYANEVLANPANDAIDMAVQLSTLGYKIHGGGPALNLDRSGMEQAVQDFVMQLPEEAHVVFYFAGHGMATKVDNYLIPIRHNVTFEEQLADQTVSLSSVIELLKIANPNGINVLLLDACRNNPLSRRSRSMQQGLMRYDNIPQGIFIGYAADYGQVADDGSGRNGAYTGELLQMLRDEPNVVIELAHKNVKNRVYEKTDRKQSPVSENKIYGGDWCFAECHEPVAKVQPIVTTRVQTVENTSDDEPLPTQTNKRWMVVGGVVLGIVAAGLASASSGDSADNTFSVEINNN